MFRFLLFTFSFAFLLVSLTAGFCVVGNAHAGELSPGKHQPVVKPSENLAKVLQTANKYTPSAATYGAPKKKSSLTSLEPRNKKLSTHKTNTAKKAAYKKPSSTKSTAHRQGKANKGTAQKKKPVKKQA